MILILDYGSQTTQLIARRVRELSVYSQIVPFDANLQEHQGNVKGVILSGGPSSVYEDKAPHLPKEILQWNVPILGICYGAQLIAHEFGGKVEASNQREFGNAFLHASKDSKLFSGIHSEANVWMSHGDKILKMPDGFDVTAKSPTCEFAAYENQDKQIFGVQFHPEVTHTPIGKHLLENFVIGICKHPQDWTMGSFIESQINEIQKKVGDKNVICALSGGVDSAVVAALLYKAIGDQCKAIYVDTGLQRMNESQHVAQLFSGYSNFDLKIVDAKNRYFDALKGVEEPERKRKIIGGMFIEIFDEHAKQYDNVEFLAQGTLYPDVIESVSIRGASHTIKTHHNVGGLPEKMNLKLVEPLRELFKDEVRQLGRELGLPETQVNRHPFPGPGLGVRILGEVTAERVNILQQADQIFIEELHAHSQYGNVWQALTVLLPVKSVGVMGDYRTYENVCAVRAVTSEDGMTADWAKLPYDLLGKVSNRIINEVRGINRVVYDISSKPPATIEWE
ncbi:MAG: glutamine-hydrolyzing GMP synthase [Bdellovibrionota bacterium]